MKANGKNREKILQLPEKIQKINITKKAIYYTILENEEYKIYQHNYKDDKPKVITKTQYETEILVVDNWIIYKDLNEKGEKQTYRINISNKAKQKI